MSNKYNLAAVLDEFLKLSPTITVLQARAFLHCAVGEGSTQKSIEEKLGTTNATASRTLAKWMDWERPGEPGYGMIRSEVDPQDRRYRIITLTPKGHEFIRRIGSLLKGVNDNGNTSRQ